MTAKFERQAIRSSTLRLDFSTWSLSHFGDMNKTTLMILNCFFSVLLFSGCNTEYGDTNSTLQEATQEAVNPSDSQTQENTSASSQYPVLLGMDEKAPEPIPLDEDLLRDGWISLFDGSTLYGWVAECEADWSAEDGTITVSQGDVGLLRTVTTFSSYQLQLEFKSESGTNSGVFLNTPGKPIDPSSDCYELNIADADNPFPTGSLVGRKKIEGDNHSAEWQTYDITVADGAIKVYLDGNLILDYTDDAPINRGYIALQHNSGKVSFRNILLRPIGSSSLFNGQDLTGWIEYPEMDSRFSVDTNGHLYVENGRGQLETEDSYADFILQLECLTHAPNLNSGIFFRCIPGDTMMGYESQIHNGMKDNNPLTPEDHGTGGIFRRQTARRIVATDQEWFYNTIIADGDHFAVWVNGYQVSNWRDNRDSDENPRRGLRREAGTIMIQGHDPTTQISFRNLSILELPATSNVTEQ